MDLGLFNSLKHFTDGLPFCARNIDSLVLKVCSAYTQYPSDTLDKIWAMQIDCWTEILKVMGGNMYTPQHKGKDRVRTEEGSKVDLNIDLVVYNAANNYIED